MTTNKTHKEAASVQGKDASNDSELKDAVTLGDYAYQIVEKQFNRIVKQEEKVLADQDPEPLHQMRVSTRRLRTALQIFDTAIQLPKTASAKQLRNLARILGAVRDLDVQTASLQNDYQQRLGKRERKSLDQVLDSLKRQRKEAFTKIKTTFKQAWYQDLKIAYKTWLKSPNYTSVAQFQLRAALPDVLSPLLSQLLLHPSWLLSADQTSGKNSELMHDLRKECKHVRYQAEFFTPFYGDDFNQWIEDVKELQERLGVFQDAQVLHHLLATELDSKASLPELQRLIQQKQMEALSNWNDIRQQHLDPSYRYSLHQTLLQPKE